MNENKNQNRQSRTSSLNERCNDKGISFSEDINSAIETLRKGGVILYPTDTIWGLGCDASNAEAVKRVFEIKRRSPEKSAIVLVNSIAALERLVGELPEAAEQLIDVAVKPMTIIYDHAKGLAPGVAAADGSAAVRITREHYSSQLCARLRRPLLSTSANISGQAAPATFHEISPEIIDAADYVAHYRRDDNTAPAPSDIIRVTASNEIKIIR